VDNLDFDILRCNFGNLTLKTFYEALVAGVSASKNYVLEKVSSDIDVRLSNRLDCHVLDTSESFSGFALDKHLLRDAHSVTTYAALGTVGKLKLLLANCLRCAQTFEGLFSNIQMVFFQAVDNLFLTPLVVGWINIRCLDGCRLEHFLRFDICELPLKSKPWFDF